MPRYKRSAAEAELDNATLDHTAEMPPEQMEILTKLRNMWEFASLMQFIYLFGHVVKIDEDFDIEDLEAECLKPTPSERLAEIGLSILKYVSSHRGLTLDIFDEYARRQYMAKAPQRNPFGEEEEPNKFNDFDVYTRIKVLQQLSTWTFGNVDRMRSLMPQDEDHLNWRMEPLGWDRDDRSYFVLDDNRLYRRGDEPPPPPTPKVKAKSKASKKSKGRATRVSKRRRIEDSEDEEPEQDDAEAANADDTLMTNGDKAEAEEEEPGFGFTNKTWECVAITLDEYQDFMSSIFRSRDPNEKQLRARIEEDVLPIIEKRAEAMRQKQLKKIRELENLQKMATAKRSSRLADKADREKAEREEREAEDKRKRDLQMALEEQERQRKIEEGHESRRLTREQRLREREAKRILHQEELAKLEAEEQRAASQGINGDGDDVKRISERHLKSQREQHQKELEKLAQEDGKWIFDCSVCGMHGENLDDGTHSIACDKCNVWQHSKCHGFSPKQAEKEDFTFVCATCKRKEEDAKKPKIPPLKLGKSRTSDGHESPKSVSRPTTATGQPANGLPEHVVRQLDGMDNPQLPQTKPGPFGQLINGPSLSPQGQAQGPPGYHQRPISSFASHPQSHPQTHTQTHPQTHPQQPWQGSPLPPPRRPSSGYANSPPPPMTNGYLPPQHQQQHQYVHQHAIAAAGSHPGYHYPYAQPPQPGQYGYGAPNGRYMPQQPAPYQYPPQQHYNQHASRPPSQQQQQHPSPGQRNGPASPAKSHSSSPPQHVPQYGTPQSYATLPQPQLQPSPKTSLPPPAASHQQQPSPSPVKTSPGPQQQSPQPIYQRASPQNHPPTLGLTAQPAPPRANGFPAPALPSQLPPMRPASSSGSNGLVADGMAGPWPEGSKAIPQKHDQGLGPAQQTHASSQQDK